MADPENPTTDSCGRTIWNDKTRSDLLIAVMDNCNPTDDQVERIMTRVAAQGYVYNWSAAKYARPCLVLHTSHLILML